LDSIVDELEAKKPTDKPKAEVHFLDKDKKWTDDEVDDLANLLNP